MAKLILDGIPPYSQAYDFKPPGLYYAYAFFMMIFGQSTAGIHLGLTLINVMTLFALFFLVTKWVNAHTALFSALSYGILSLGSSVLGFAAHATHFVVLPALIGIILMTGLISSPRKGASFWCGVSFGVSALMKQPALLFLILAVNVILIDWIISRNSDFKILSRSLFLLLTGAIAPMVSVAALLYFSGVFDLFYFWNIGYAGMFGEIIPPGAALRNFLIGFNQATQHYSFIWFLGAAGMISVFFVKGVKIRIYILFLFLFYSLCAVCLGLHFRQHYFILLLPAVSIFLGIFFTWLEQFLKIFFNRQFPAVISVALFAVVVYFTIIGDKDYFFWNDPYVISHRVYGKNPFPESIVIADSIRKRTAVSDKIAVLGSEPQILFYADRYSATPYIFSYFFMEKHSHSLRMQREMANDIEKNEPKIIVYAVLKHSWSLLPGSEKYIFSWAEKYLNSSYDIIGVVDIISSAKTVYRWDLDAIGYGVQSKSYLLVYQRKTRR